MSVSAPRCARSAAAVLVGTIVLLVCAPARALAGQECAGADAEPSAQTLEAAAVAVVCLVNFERARHGRAQLRRDADLRQAARRHSRDMVRRRFFAHVNPGGADVADRLRRSGYIHGGGAWQIGETIAWGTGSLATPAGIVAAWIASPPHHRILLKSGFRDVGVGVAAGVPVSIDGGSTGATYTLDTGVISG
jgi:uncharacterized protein YkwD